MHASGRSAQTHASFSVVARSLPTIRLSSESRRTPHPSCSTSPCCARTWRRSSPGSRRASRRSRFSTSIASRALEAERKAMQTRTEELQARRNALSQADRQAEGARADDASAAMAEVAGIGDELEALGRAARSDPGRADGAADGAAEPARRRACRSAPTRTRTSRCGAGARRAHSTSRRATTSTSARRSASTSRPAAKLSGSRFSFLRGPVARLHRALAQFMLDVQTRRARLHRVLHALHRQPRGRSRAPASCRSSRTTCSGSTARRPTRTSGRRSST